MTTATLAAPQQSPLPSIAAAPAPARLMSLDALRGFDMFWIIGGDRLMKALYAYYPKVEWLKWADEQTTHVDWDGFVFYDLIFPLFLFISGVTMPLSLTGRLDRGEPKSRLYWRVARRSLLLVLLGMICNGLLKLDFANTRYPSVLGRIGLAYGLAAIIVLNTRLRGQIIALLAILLGYWAMMTLIPVPGHGAGVLTMEGSLAGYVDSHVLPGKLYKGIHDPEGLVSTIPAVATALLGAMAGHWLMSRRAGWLKGLGLLAAGGACWAVGWQWNHWFPVNKNLWSSSFVLVAGAWSLMLLGTFYLIIDVIRLRRWAFVFMIIGVNPITIYLLRGRIIDFDKPAHFFFDGLMKFATPRGQVVWLVVAVLFLEWLLLYFLYRKKVFLRV